MTAKASVVAYQQTSRGTDPTTPRPDMSVEQQSANAVGTKVHLFEDNPRLYGREQRGKILSCLTTIPLRHVKCTIDHQHTSPPSITLNPNLAGRTLEDHQYRMRHRTRFIWVASAFLAILVPAILYLAGFPLWIMALAAMLASIAIPCLMALENLVKIRLLPYRLVRQDVRRHAGRKKIPARSNLSKPMACTKIIAPDEPFDQAVFVLLNSLNRLPEDPDGETNPDRFHKCDRGITAHILQQNATQRPRMDYSEIYTRDRATVHYKPEARERAFRMASRIWVNSDQLPDLPSTLDPDKNPDKQQIKAAFALPEALKNSVFRKPLDTSKRSWLYRHLRPFWEWAQDNPIHASCYATWFAIMCLGVILCLAVPQFSIVILTHHLCQMIFPLLSTADLLSAATFMGCLMHLLWFTPLWTYHLIAPPYSRSKGMIKEPSETADLSDEADMQEAIEAYQFYQRAQVRNPAHISMGFAVAAENSENIEYTLKEYNFPKVQAKIRSIFDQHENDHNITQPGLALRNAIEAITIYQIADTQFECSTSHKCHDPHENSLSHVHRGIFTDRWSDNFIRDRMKLIGSQCTAQQKYYRFTLDLLTWLLLSMDMKTRDYDKENFEALANDFDAATSSKPKKTTDDAPENTSDNTPLPSGKQLQHKPKRSTDRIGRNLSKQWATRTAPLSLMQCEAIAKILLNTLPAKETLSEAILPNTKTKPLPLRETIGHTVFGTTGRYGICTKYKVQKTDGRIQRMPDGQPGDYTLPIEQPPMAPEQAKRLEDDFKHKPSTSFSQALITAYGELTTSVDSIISTTHEKNPTPLPPVETGHKSDNQLSQPADSFQKPSSSSERKQRMRTYLNNQPLSNSEQPEEPQQESMKTRGSDASRSQISWMDQTASTPRPNRKFVQTTPPKTANQQTISDYTATKSTNIIRHRFIVPPYQYHTKKTTRPSLCSPAVYGT